MQAYLPINQSWSIFNAILVIQIKERSRVKGTGYVTVSWAYETKVDNSHYLHKQNPNRVNYEDSLLLFGLGFIFLGLNSSNSLQNSLMSITNGLIKKKEGKKENKTRYWVVWCVKSKNKDQNLHAMNQPADQQHYYWSFLDLELQIAKQIHKQHIQSRNTFIKC